MKPVHYCSKKQDTRMHQHTSTVSKSTAYQKAGQGQAKGSSTNPLIERRSKPMCSGIFKIESIYSYFLDIYLAI